MKKKNIAIVSGGNSGEYEISIKSAREVAKELDKERYNVYLLIIREKDWYYKDAERRKIAVDKNDFSLTVDGQKILFDVVFNAIHGTPGEDGKLQGYFDMLRIPYTSCNHEVSALTFHKGFCNQLVRSFEADGLRVADSILLTGDELFDVPEIIEKIGLPCFVKAAKSGSSVGVSKAKKPEDIPVAIETAFEVCNEILIERFVKGRELTCAVSNFKGAVKTWPLAEIVSKKEFFDFEAKYDDNLNQEIIPAPVSEALTKQIQDISKILFQKLRCSGVVRFDYIVTESEEIYFLEVNAIPGMTSASIVPKMVQYEGVSLRDFYTMAIEHA